MPQVHLTLVPSPDPPGSEITETQTDISRISAFLGLLYVIMRAARETTPDLAFQQASLARLLSLLSLPRRHFARFGLDRPSPG